MDLKELFLGGGGFLLILLTLIQVTPIKLNPWSWVGKMLGRALNAEVLRDIEEIKASQRETNRRLAEHIAVDDERNADGYRQRILQFNNDLVRDIYHDREDFVEILLVMDRYERYCNEHKNYKNNRAINAISNINRVYNERLKKHDF